VAASRSYIWLGEYEAAIEVAARGVAATSNDSIRRQLIWAHVAAGHFDLAETIGDRDIRSERQAGVLQVIISAARGEVEKTKVLINDFIAAGFEDSDLLVVMLAVAGERDLVNNLVAEIDARPFGYLQLMQLPLVCACGAPFDLAATPNFARLLEDASLTWPTTSPIAWPLKDW